MDRSGATAVGTDTHPRMPMSERAKIFVPFDPLRGFSEALRAKEREVEAEALDDRGGNDLEAPDKETLAAEVDLEAYLTAEDLAEGQDGWFRTEA